MGEHQRERRLHKQGQKRYRSKIEQERLFPKFISWQTPCLQPTLQGHLQLDVSLEIWEFVGNAWELVGNAWKLVGNVKSLALSRPNESEILEVGCSLLLCTSLQVILMLLLSL